MLARRTCDPYERRTLRSGIGGEAGSVWRLRPILQSLEHEAGSPDYYFELIRFYWYCDGCGAEREKAESKATPGLDVSCPKCKTPAVLAEVTSWRVKQTPPDKNVSSPRLMRVRAWMTRLCGNHHGKNGPKAAVHCIIQRPGR
jgi:hypothetical protein